MATAQSSTRTRPMRAGESVAYMGIVAALGLGCFYGLRPWLERARWASYPAYLASLSIVFVLLLVWSLAAYRAEGRPWSLRAYLQRNRLESVQGKTVLWGIGLGAFMFLLTAAFSPLLSWAISAGLLPLPAGIPDYLDPSRQQSLALIKQQFVEQGILPLIPIVVVLNIAAEELFWRGMVFPRQELVHGKYTFIVHGLVWAFSHLFQYWMLPPILIGSLALAWTVQHSRSTWVGVIAHLANNGLPFLLMLVLSA
jgi:membrane protease YdiL (CAAX protease family)